MKINFLIILFIFSSFLVHSQNKSIEFEHDKTWEEIVAKAKKEKKIIFIDCYTTWCRPCKWIAKNVFTRDEVADFFNENFVCAKIDMEKGEGPKIAQQFSVQEYPTLLYVNSKEEKVYVTVGSVNAETLIRYGKTALDPDKNIPGQKTKYKNGERNSKFIYEFLKILKTSHDNSIPQVIEGYFKSQKESDLTSEINWNITNEYVEDVDSEIMKYLINNKAKYVSKYGKKKVENKIFKTYLNNFYKVFRTQNLPAKSYFEYKNEFTSKHMYNRLDEVLVNGDLIYYKYYEKNINKYSDNVVKLVEKYKVEDPEKLNEFAWEFYKKIENKQKLIKAKSWAKKAGVSEPSANYLDTYAALLYKLGEYQEALEIEKKALKNAEEFGEDTKPYKAFIEKIKKAMK